MRSWLSRLLLVLLVSIAPQLFAQADQPAAAEAAGGDDEGGFALRGDLLTIDPELRNREREINDRVREALAASTIAVPGAGGALPEDIDLRRAALTALERNLTIKRNELVEPIAEKALQEARAVFDPLFIFSFAGTRTEFNDRVTTALRFRRASEVVLPGNIDPAGTPATINNIDQFCRQSDGACDRVFFQEGPIAFIEFDQARPARFSPSRVTAAEDPVTGPSSNLTSSVSINQLLPWGYSLSVGINGRYQRAQFVNNPDNPVTARAGFYNRDWSASLSASAFLPVPLSSRFGLGDPSWLNYRIQERSLDAAVWTVRAVTNATLLEVETAFWNLVLATQLVVASGESRALAESLNEWLDRQVEEFLITAGDEAQLRSRIDRLRTAEQEAIGNLILASNRLSELLDRQDQTLLLPVGYLAALDQELEQRGEAAMVLDNPAYQQALIQTDIAEIVRAGARRRSWPDLNITASITMSQNATPFGFQSPQDSLGHLFFNADRTVSSFGVSLREPILRRAIDADVDTAVASLERTQLQQKQTALTLKQTYDTSLATLDSARVRVGITRRNEELAEKLFAQAEENARDFGLVPAYELAERMLVVLSARQARIQAEIAAKLAESQVLAALGMLTQRFAERTAQTPYDTTRLAHLQEAGERSFFGAWQ